MSIEKNAKKLKVTVDTNILVSAFVFPGSTVIRIFDDVFDDFVELGLSDDILREFSGICVRKFDYEPEEAVKKADMVRHISKMVYPEQKVNVIKDEPDNRILECADKFRADYIISGDKHLLQLQKYKGVLIITPADYLRRKP